MQKKNCAITEVLLSLVLILGSIGFACSAEPAPAPVPPASEPAPTAPEPTPPPLPPTSTPPRSSLPLMEPDPDIPANFTTYTDSPQLFSISYPSDWELALSYLSNIETNTEKIISSLQTGLPMEEDSIIFIAGGIKSTVVDPGVGIVVEPILAEPPKGVSALDQRVESAVTVMKTVVLQDYKEFSRVKTTINGREAVIVDYEGIPRGADKHHYVMMITLAGKTAWRVTCSSPAEYFTALEKDFNTIVRSLRISIE